VNTDSSHGIRPHVLSNFHVIHHAHSFGLQYLVLCPDPIDTQKVQTASPPSLVLALSTAILYFASSCLYTLFYSIMAATAAATTTATSPPPPPRPTTAATPGVTVAAAALLGWILSAYALYVEYRVMAHPTASDDEQPFTALCDIPAIAASCSTVFTLPQGRMLSYFGMVDHNSMLDLPNAALGMMHYTYLLLVLLPRSRYMPAALTQCAVASAFVSTLFLAYQLTFVLHELCVLCWTTHVINTYIFYCYFFQTSRTSRSTNKTKTA
jgi:vitamin-K-epoxide reductase (warfarin-sensitive)